MVSNVTLCNQKLPLRVGVQMWDHFLCAANSYSLESSFSCLFCLFSKWSSGVKLRDGGGMSFMPVYTMVFDVETIWLSRDYASANCLPAGANHDHPQPECDLHPSACPARYRPRHRSHLCPSAVALPQNQSSLQQQY